MKMNRVGCCFFLMRRAFILLGHFPKDLIYYNSSYIKDFIGYVCMQGRKGGREGGNGRRSSSDANHVRSIDGDEIESILFLHSWNKNLPCKQHKKKGPAVPCITG